MSGGHTLQVGDVLDDRYRVEGVLGEGGFAVVYRATDLSSGRVVALKVMVAALLESERSRARFEREVEIVARLQSPHTVKVFSRGTAPGGGPYIVFEYVPGRDLRQILNERDRLDEAVVRHLLRQVLMALVEAHRAGVVHRDLKPANIQVFEYDGDPWCAKVLDFGVALALREHEPRLTGANELVGTPRYMSPEQLLGDEPGPASDIYALGVVAWELLVGPAALHGPRWGDQLARLQSGFHVADETRDFGELGDLIHRMTARDVQQRFGSAEAVLRALNALAPAPSATVPALRGPRPGPERPVLDAHPTEVRVEDHPSPPSRWWWLLVIPVVLAGVMLLWPGAEDERAATVPPSLLATTTERVPPRVTTVDAGLRADASSRDAGNIDMGMDGTPGCGRSLRTGRQAIRDPSSRRWRVMYIPQGYDPNRRYPVVLMIGTLAVLPHWFFESTQISELADREGFVVVMLDRINRLQAWSAADADFVFAELGEVAESTCLDTTRIYALGHGTGTELAREVACRSKLAGLALVGDVELVGSRCDASPVPVIRFAGRDDPYVPLGGGVSCVGQAVRSAAEIEASWQEVNGCSEQQQSWGSTKAGKCRAYACESEPFVACRIDGGHNWPNSRPQPEMMDRSCPDRPTRYPIMDSIWAFFEEVAEPAE